MWNYQSALGPGKTWCSHRSLKERWSRGDRVGFLSGSPHSPNNTWNHPGIFPWYNYGLKKCSHLDIEQYEHMIWFSSHFWSNRSMSVVRFVSISDVKSIITWFDVPKNMWTISPYIFSLFLISLNSEIFKRISWGFFFFNIFVDFVKFYYRWQKERWICTTLRYLVTLAISNLLRHRSLALCLWFIVYPIKEL